jgi:hypothetical protein
MTRTSYARQLSWMFALGVWCSVAATAIAGPLRIVTLAGPAPGAGAGVNFSGIFGPPVLNNTGQTAFSADLTGTGVTSGNNTGIWSEGSGTLALVAREGSPAPAIDAGVNFGLFDPPRLNSAGQIAFRATLTGSGVTSSNDTGIWSEGSGTLALVAREGSPAPFTGENFRQLPNSPAFNSAGQTAFRALTGTSNSESIWSEGSGALAMVARVGDAAPGIANGGTFRSFSAGPSLNSAGGIVFSALTSNLSQWAGIWTARTTLDLVVKDDDPAPGLGAEIGAVDGPVINSSGHIAFRSAGISNGINVTAVWVDYGGGPNLVARDEDAAPGTGAVFNISPPILSLNSAGQTAFSTSLAGAGVTTSNDSGIWSEGSGALTLVAREGSPAPGTGAGVNFGNFKDLASPINPAFNSAGQTAFFATLTGTGVTSLNNQGIWAEDPLHNLRLIAREGDLLEISPDLFRTVGSLDFVGGSGNETGRASSGFNDLGQVAFYAEFTDGSSGIFVSDVSSVPPNVPGDYNNNGAVDAADYTVWRDQLGSLTSLLNDDTAGVGPDDYDRWRSHFGESAGGGTAAGAQSSVPEATSICTTGIAILLMSSATARLRRSQRMMTQSKGHRR